MSEHQPAKPDLAQFAELVLSIGADNFTAFNRALANIKPEEGPRTLEILKQLLELRHQEIIDLDYLVRCSQLRQALAFRRIPPHYEDIGFSIENRLTHEQQIDCLASRMGARAAEMLSSSEYIDDHMLECGETYHVVVMKSLPEDIENPKAVLKQRVKARSYIDPPAGISTCLRLVLTDPLIKLMGYERLEPMHDPIKTLSDGQRRRFTITPDNGGDFLGTTIDQSAQYVRDSGYAYLLPKHLW